MRKWLILLFTLPLRLCAAQTNVSSDAFIYNGDWVTLSGNVMVENAMGKIQARCATLKKDPEGQSSIDFPWIELKNEVSLELSRGGILRCESVFLDWVEKTSILHGNPQMSFTGAFGEICAEQAKIDYREANGSIEPTKVTLLNNVRFVNAETNPQYALADIAYYYPEEKRLVMEGKEAPVLFYDPSRGLQLAARTLYAQKDPVTKKEKIQGVGAVRFTFGPEELEKIKQRFPFKNDSKR